jgi:hypothetical protein
VDRHHNLEGQVDQLDQEVRHPVLVGQVVLVDQVFEYQFLEDLVGQAHRQFPQDQEAQVGQFVGQKTNVRRRL